VIRDFVKVVDALGGEPGVSRGKMLGSEGLKVGKSVFAMEVQGKLVVKLSAGRAVELRDADLAEAFDPVSPPAKVGASSDGLTGHQGPTRWFRRRRLHPCRADIAASTRSLDGVDLSRG
jgi:hypothetical protein